MAAPPQHHTDWYSKLEQRLLGQGALLCGRVGMENEPNQDSLIMPMKLLEFEFEAYMGDEKGT